MEQPYKLYIENRKHRHNYLTACVNNIKDDDVEYVRKDAFIESAQKWLKENVSNYLYNTGGRDEYIPTCSSKMFEDFNKAMML